MFGFVNSHKKGRKLGGEIFQESQRRKRISFIIAGIIAFIILNLILYYLTTV